MSSIGVHTEFSEKRWQFQNGTILLVMNRFQWNLVLKCKTCFIWILENLTLKVSPTRDAVDTPYIMQWDIKMPHCAKLTRHSVRSKSYFWPSNSVARLVTICLRRKSCFFIQDEVCEAAWVSGPENWRKCFFLTYYHYTTYFATIS